MKRMKMKLVVFYLLLCSVVYSKDFIKIKYNEKYGLLDSNFNIVFPTIYSNIIIDNKRFLLIDNKTVIIKENNRTNSVIAKHRVDTIEKISDSIYLFSGRGPCSIYDFDKGKFVLQGKYINKSLFGVYLTEMLSVENYYISLDDLEEKHLFDKNYIRTYPFIEDRAIVLKDDWVKSLINKEGEIILDNIVNSGWEFCDGLLPVITNTKSGFINIEGEFVIECPIVDEYKTTNSSGNPTLPCYFSDGLAYVHSSENEWIIIDKKGNEITEVNYPSSSSIFSEGLLNVFQDGKCGYINTKGELVIPLVFDDANKFDNGYAIVIYNGEDAIIDKKGNIYLTKDLITGNKDAFVNVCGK